MTQKKNAKTILHFITNQIKICSSFSVHQWYNNDQNTIALARPKNDHLFIIAVTHGPREL